MLRNIKNNITKFFAPFVLFLSVIILLFSIYIYGVGYHNIDTGQNMNFLEADLDIVLHDRTLQGIDVDGLTAYALGHWQVRLSFFLMMIGGMLFGGSFVDMVNKL